MIRRIIVATGLLLYSIAYAQSATDAGCLHSIGTNRTNPKVEEECGMSLNTPDLKSVSDPAESDPYYRPEKYNSNGGFIAGSYNWKNGNCDFEDAQKFRGRGFKQLTGRSNYADYWLYRGWIQQSSFTNSWWTDPQFVAKHRSAMSKVSAIISNPDFVASAPSNCIDSGAWYITSLRPKLMQEIDKDSLKIAATQAEINAEKNAIKKVAKGINGTENGLSDRVKYTRMAKEMLL